LRGVVGCGFWRDGAGGLACKSVQVAWVIETNGTAEEARGMVEKLTRVLDHFSTRATVQQAVKKTAEGKRNMWSFGIRGGRGG